MIKRCEYYFWHQWVACVAVATIDVLSGLFRLATLGLLRIDGAGALALRIMDWSLTKAEITRFCKVPPRPERS